MSTDTYDFGEFRLDIPSRQLLRRGEGVSITPRVFDTLLFFLQHPGRVLGKDELMKAIWPDAFVEENNLNQTVSALRRALGESRGDNRYVVTVPGHGYRFGAEVQTGSSDTKPAATATRKVAVLPFKPLVEVSRDEALELGMADTLIARLSRIREIVVRPLSSVRRYTALEQDPQSAGRSLGVECVLDGCIQRWGDRLRVTARLTSVHDGSTLWADTMDESFTDLFAVQDAISERVAGALEVHLSSAESMALTHRYTENAEAYELYLKGRYHWSKLTPPEVKESLRFFERAAELDPGYALAYAGMLEAYRSLPISADVPPRDVFPLATLAASKALQIDESLVEVHASLAFIKLWYDWDGQGALREAERAVALNPNSSEARRSYAHVLWGLGRFDAAVAEGARARELDPLALLTSAQEGMYLFSAGRLGEARARLVKTLEIEPNFWIALLWLAKVDIFEGKYADALDKLTEAKLSSLGNSETIALIGYASALSGDRARALEVLDELTARSEKRYVPPYSLALVLNGLGDDEKALESLERAYEERDVRFYWLKIDPFWDRMRTNPMFESLVNRMAI